MQYSNPDIPEGINATRENPFKELIILGVAAVVLVIVLSLVLGASGGYLAGRFVSYETEQNWAQGFEPEPFASSALEAYLGELTQQVRRAMGIEYDVIVRYSDEDVVNAFATIGGNVVFYRGLLARLPNEDSLIMLIAHELAHIHHRDPIQGLGKAMGIQLGMALITGSGDLPIVGQSGQFTLLSFSRSMEQNADAAGLQALNNLKGHSQGALDLFDVFKQYRKEEGGAEGLALFSSHPLDDKRIANIHAIADFNAWQLTGEATPLPEGFKRWLYEVDSEIIDPVP